VREDDDGREEAKEEVEEEVEGRREEGARRRGRNLSRKSGKVGRRKEKPMTC